VAGTTRRFVAALVAVAAVAAAFAAGARAANRVYWSNYDNNTISFANLDGSGSGGQLNTSGATPPGAIEGVAIDGAAGLFYWANNYTGKISYARLDGSGGGDLNTAGASTMFVYGLALDPEGGRVYWADVTGVSYAKLDGTGGGNLNTMGASVSDPFGIAVDQAGARVYWTNNTGTTISYAKLDGSGGGDLVTTGATVNRPGGLAVDPAGARLYWTNGIVNVISWAALNGSGGGSLSTTGAHVAHPEAVAIDKAAGRIYWTNFSGSVVSYARLDGSGGGDVAITGATASNPAFLALLEAPGAAGAPAVSGGKRPGSRLSCTEGSWLADLAPAFLAQAPQTFSYRWARDGHLIGLARSSAYAPGKAGSYRCSVTAENAAGTAVQTSEAHTILADCIVPKVVGKTLRTAKRAIRRKHCRVGKVRRAHSARVLTGRVLSQRPRPGSHLRNGSKVNLIVSRG
jgi:DNA-binding beta-propeller fold protein YncE